MASLRLGILVVFVLGAARAALAADVPGSADLPGIGRFEGSEITHYRVQSFGETTFATGPVAKRADPSENARRVEGRITRIVYKVPPGSSALEVFRNFENEMRSAGWEIAFSGGPDEIDGYTFVYKHPVEVLAETSISTGEIRYAYATKSADGTEEILGLLVSPHSGGDGQRVRLVHAAIEAMQDRMVDAAAMQQAIAETGRVALYGIYFDTDSDAIKAESAPTLTEIARFLSSSPGVKVIVVGHTDTQGSFDHNLDLSRRRAASVLRALTADHGVAAARLRSAGVGYLAPAATNDTPEGRALNRRVELVKEP